MPDNARVGGLLEGLWLQDLLRESHPRAWADLDVDASMTPCLFASFFRGGIREVTVAFNEKFKNRTLSWQGQRAELTMLKLGWP